MYINIRVKRKTTEIVTLRCPVPDDLRDYEDDTLTDVASDWLDDNGVEYKWFRVLKNKADHVSRVVGQVDCNHNDKTQYLHSTLKYCYKCHSLFGTAAQDT